MTRKLPTIAAASVLSAGLLAGPVFAAPGGPYVASITATPDRVVTMAPGSHVTVPITWSDGRLPSGTVVTPRENDGISAHLVGEQGRLLVLRAAPDVRVGQHDLKLNAHGPHGGRAVINVTVNIIDAPVPADGMGSTLLDNILSYVNALST